MASLAVSTAGLGGHGASVTGNGVVTRLTPYQVALCSLLVRYAELGTLEPGVAPSPEVQSRLFEALFREVRVVHRGGAVRPKSVRELQRDLLSCDADGHSAGAEELWRDFIARLRAVDSPDALFDLFHSLDVALTREPGLTAPVHASGLFGHFARRCVLAFKEASFEVAVKLYDAVREYVEEFEQADRAARREAASTGCQSSASAPPLTGGTARGLGTALSAAPQLGQLAQGLVRDLPLSVGIVPFPRVDAALRYLQEKLPQCNVVHFLRYMNSLQNRMVDDAGQCLRAFHDGTQQGPAGWPLAAHSEDGLPDMIQNASLALASMHAEMRHTDDALQALGESIRASQEASDAGCLCACLYMLGLVLLQSGLTGNAFAMLRRCLHRSETIGSPTLQSLCCLGIARTLAERPTLSDRRQRGLLWKESISKMAAADTAHHHGSGPAVLRAQPGGGSGGQGSGGGGAGGAGVLQAGRGGSFGSAGGAQRGGLGVLAALLSDDAAAGSGTASGAGAAGAGVGVVDLADLGHSGAACRDALAHTVVASQLSVQAKRLGESRPKVLLCQAEVARMFGLQPLAGAACRLALDVYSEDLGAEERALTLCQLASETAETNLAEALPLFRSLAEQLPHGGHLWAHVAGPCLVHALLASGESAAASALLWQAAGLAKAVPQGSTVGAIQRVRAAANDIRLYHTQLLAAHRSAREAVEAGQRVGSPGDVCTNLLCLADTHLVAKDPVRALGACLRCLSAAEASRLLKFRAEALVRIARVRLEMRDLQGALHLAEEVTPQLGAGSSAKTKGDALVVQGEVLLSILARLGIRGRVPEAATRERLLREVVRVFGDAAEQFQAVSELNRLRRCYYVLARSYHELGDTAARNQHAGRFRRISQHLVGKSDGSCATRPWDEPRSGPQPSGSSAGSSAAQPVASAQQGAARAPPPVPRSFSPRAAAPPPPRNFVESRSPMAEESSGQGAKKEDGKPRCPALSQLLALAEGGGNGGEGDESLLGSPLLGGRDSPSAAPRASVCAAAGVVPARTGGLPTSLGRGRALYPMTAVLSS